MKFRIMGDLIVDDEHKFTWHIAIIKNDDNKNWNNAQKESKNKITDWLKRNHPELLL